MGGDRPAWLTPELEARLGIDSDTQLAKAAGVSRWSVRKERERRGIKARERRKQFPEKAMELLGVVDDKEIARRFAIRRRWVFETRTELGIPAVRRENRWLTKELEALLGTMSDRALADIAGVSPSRVASARKRRQIQAARPSRARDERAWATPNVVARLGKVPDTQLAKELGLYVDAIREERKHRGIPSTWRRAWLTPEVQRQIGRVPDHVVAQLAGVAPTSIQRERLKHGLPAVTWPTSTDDWLTADVIARLGTVSDGQLSRELEVPTGTVAWVRRELGIEACLPAQAEWLTDEVRQQLGNVPDRELADAIGVSVGSIQGARKRAGIPPFPSVVRPWLTDEVRSRLGTVPDRTLARELGVSYKTVGQVRNTLGIAVYRARPEWLTDDVRRRLGTQSDASLARELGLPAGVVSARRVKLGIERFRKLLPGKRRAPPDDPDH